jgi:Amt family ammonium transporter
MLKYDDSLDVFGVHGVGGIVGALLTGVFVNPALGGSGVYDYAADAVAAYSFSGQMTSQLWGILLTIVWSGVVSLVALYIIKATIGLRVSEQEEREGLDVTTHGERAYN